METPQGALQNKKALSQTCTTQCSSKATHRSRKRTQPSSNRSNTYDIPGDSNRECHRSFHKGRRGFTCRSSALTCTSSWWKTRLRNHLLDDSEINWSIPCLGNQEEVDAGVDPSAEDTQFSVIATKRADDPKPQRDHHVFTHFPKDPNCEICRTTTTTRARFQNRPLKRRWDLASTTDTLTRILLPHRSESNGIEFDE